MNYNTSLPLSTELLSSIRSFKISVLLIDDQPIIAEVIKRILMDQTDIIFHYCSDPSKALEIALEVNPTVILQDLVMPQVDGLMLVKYFRDNPSTCDVPIIVLSSKEEPQIKADVFGAGANDYLIKVPNPVELIARIRYHSGAYIRLLERNEAFKKLEESELILQNDLSEAATYVKSLLPPLLQGNIKTNWRFIPSTHLGGDIFGYHWLDDRYFAMYLLDVCGHGVGAALMSISIGNVLRFQNLPKADFHDPSSVLQALNAAFQMENHNNMFFTMWYGVYDSLSKQILYATGGHPPAVLVTGETMEKVKIHELTTSGIGIGVLLNADYQNASCLVEDFNYLFIFSDGAYEISRIDGTMLGLNEFIDILKKAPIKDEDKLDYIVQIIQDIQGKKIFADDFSLLEITFKK